MVAKAVVHHGGFVGSGNLQSQVFWPALQFCGSVSRLQVDLHSGENMLLMLKCIH